MYTTIKAKKHLYNYGRCFSADHFYKVVGEIKTAAGLMEARAINDQDQWHVIGNWWREFEIIETTEQ